MIMATEMKILMGRGGDLMSRTREHEDVYCCAAP